MPFSLHFISSVQVSSVAQSSPTLCDSKYCSMSIRIRASLIVPRHYWECEPSLVKVVSTRSHYCTFALLLFCLLEVSHSLAPSEGGG